MNMDILPDAAKSELMNFYNYLVFKYVTEMENSKATPPSSNKDLNAFKRFKKFRDHVNPVIDKPVEIDKLINEAYNDIF